MAVEAEGNGAQLSASQRAALLLMALGENAAAEVLKHLEPNEVEAIGATMRGLRDVTQDQIAAVLDEFIARVGKQSSLGMGAEEYLKSVLRKALGREKAEAVLSRISLGSQSKGLEMLKWLDPQTIYELIRDEHPQIIAIVLVYLEKGQAARVLAAFDENRRAEILMRIATMDSIHPEALAELDAIMEQRFASGGAVGKIRNVGGARSAAELLNALGGQNAQALLDAIRQRDESLGTQLEEQMFVFENLLELSDRDMQTLLREVNTDQLVVALKGASPEMQNKVFRNMSSRAAEMLRDDLEARGPVKLKEVEEAQKAILEAARKLAEDGKISLGGGGEEYV
ncbi:MAG: flagellar motor switch protein FliG [Gammaproteobacteria bacterium]|nr:MAG: flagellar motor switch protein FliG [Gammaproteobacteria bacterium]